jgi:hypothetical protein
MGPRSASIVSYLSRIVSGEIGKFTSFPLRSRQFGEHDSTCFAQWIDSVNSFGYRLLQTSPISFRNHVVFGQILSKMLRRIKLLAVSR